MLLLKTVCKQVKLIKGVLNNNGFSIHSEADFENQFLRLLVDNFFLKKKNRLIHQISLIRRTKINTNSNTILSEKIQQTILTMIILPIYLTPSPT